MHVFAHGPRYAPLIASFDMHAHMHASAERQLWMRLLIGSAKGCKVVLRSLVYFGELQIKSADLWRQFIPVGLVMF